MILSLSVEQKQKYFKKDSPKSGIVYKITNILNGDCYIGSSNNLYKRYYTHLYDFRWRKKGCTLLIRAVNKYGEDNFKLEIICECDKEEVLFREQKYIDELNPKYNISKIAGSNLGVKRSELTKKRKSISQKNNWINKEYRDKHLFHLSKNWGKGENHVMAKITEKDAAFIKNKIKEGLKPKQISDIFGYSYNIAKDIWRNKTWKNVEV